MYIYESALFLPGTLPYISLTFIHIYLYTSHTLPWPYLVHNLFLPETLPAIAYNVHSSLLVLFPYIDMPSPRSQPLLFIIRLPSVTCHVRVKVPSGVLCCLLETRTFPLLCILVVYSRSPPLTFYFFSWYLICLKYTFFTHLVFFLPKPLYIHDNILTLFFLLLYI